MSKKDADIIREFLSDKEIVKEIISDLNKEIVYCPILRNIQRELKCGVCAGDVIMFSKLCNEDRNEVFVYLGRILESIITCKLSKKFPVLKDRTSAGDVVTKISQILIWEIKGTSSDNSWQGSTHASSKEDKLINFIGVKYGFNNDVNVFDLISGKDEFIQELFIVVAYNYRFIRVGKASKNNSRTSLYCSIFDYDLLKDQVAWGNFAYPARGIYKKDGTLKKNVKYLVLETAS